MEGKPDRQPALAAELVRLKVDVIVTVGPGRYPRSQGSDRYDSHCHGAGGDPVGSGFVASLARPGGNITGLSTLRPELSGKRLELLKEIVPKLSRVAVLRDSTSRGQRASVERDRARRRGVRSEASISRLLSPKDFETAFRAASKGRADAVLDSVPGPILTPHRKQIAELAVKSRLPAIYERPEYVEAGGLMSYGVNITDLYRRAATYVDKILKGAKPADLPVEQPTKFEFMINLKAAKQIGLTIPPNVLARADKVIKMTFSIFDCRFSIEAEINK